MYHRKLQYTVFLHRKRKKQTVEDEKQSCISREIDDSQYRCWNKFELNLALLVFTTTLWAELQFIRYRNNSSHRRLSSSFKGGVRQHIHISLTSCFPVHWVQYSYTSSCFCVLTELPSVCVMLWRIKASRCFLLHRRPVFSLNHPLQEQWLVHATFS